VDAALGNQPLVRTRDRVTLAGEVLPCTTHDTASFKHDRQHMASLFFHARRTLAGPRRARRGIGSALLIDAREMSAPNAWQPRRYSLPAQVVGYFGTLVVLSERPQYRSTWPGWTPKMALRNR
jgi:hypothetical protein